MNKVTFDRAAFPVHRSCVSTDHGQPLVAKGLESLRNKLVLALADCYGIAYAGVASHKKVRNYAGITKPTSLAERGMTVSYRVAFPGNVPRCDPSNVHTQLSLKD